MSSSPETWDVAVVGAGPAGAAAALGVLSVQPGARVVLLDRAQFPRDKVCGDGIAPHALDVLEGVGVVGLLDDWPVAPRLRIWVRGGPDVEQPMRRPSWVVPREVFDARLLDAALARGAQLRQARVRHLAQDGAGVALDDGTRARVLIGADGAHSVVRRELGEDVVGRQRPGTTAIALRGYAPVRPEHAQTQVLAFAEAGPRPRYAWSFPVGDGRANVGYGELVPAGRAQHPTRAELLAGLEDLLPGASEGATALAGHPLPLSTGRTGRWASGRVLLAGDAASLVNPVTGEGIYYAVLSGVIAGQAAAESLALDEGVGAGDLYTRRLRAAVGAHLRHTDLAARLVESNRLLGATLRTAQRDPRAFDDLADIGLARGKLTPRVLRGLATTLVGAGRR